MSIKTFNTTTTRNLSKFRHKNLEQPWLAKGFAAVAWKSEIFNDTSHGYLYQAVRMNMNHKYKMNLYYLYVAKKITWSTS